MRNKKTCRFDWNNDDICHTKLILHMFCTITHTVAKVKH